MTCRNTAPIRNYVIVALVSAGLGAGAMWLFIGHESESPKTSVEFSASDAQTPPSTDGLAPGQAQLLLANWNYDRKNWPHAIEHYQKAIALGLDNADVRTDLGNCYRFSGESQKALEQYQLAQKENPQHENSLFNIATLYQQVLGEPAKAAEAFREFLNRFPEAQNATAARQFLAGANKSPAQKSEIANWLEGQTRTDAK